MNKINDFLTEAKVFFLATTDGNQPKLRPLGFKAMVDGKLIFAVGSHKDVYKQMVANPLVEINALNDKMQWLRYSGKVVFEEDPKYGEILFEAIPSLRAVYEAAGARPMAFHLEDAKADIRSVSGEVVETIC